MMLMMIRRTTACIGMVVIAAAPLAAQKITTGSRLQVQVHPSMHEDSLAIGRAEAPKPRTYTGNVVSWTPSELTLRESAGVVDSAPLARLDWVALSRGPRSSAVGGLRGMLLGALGGALIATLADIPRLVGGHDPAAGPPPPNGRTAVGLVAGAAIGFTIGVMFPGEHWQKVYPSPTGSRAVIPILAPAPAADSAHAASH